MYAKNNCIHQYFFYPLFLSANSSSMIIFFLNLDNFILICTLSQWDMFCFPYIYFHDNDGVDVCMRVSEEYQEEELQNYMMLKCSRTWRSHSIILGMNSIAFILQCRTR